MSSYITYLMSSSKLEATVSEAKKRLINIDNEINSLLKDFSHRKNTKTNWVVKKKILKQLTELYDQSCEININLELLKYTL